MKSPAMKLAHMRLHTFGIIDHVFRPIMDYSTVPVGEHLFSFKPFICIAHNCQRSRSNCFFYFSICLCGFGADIFPNYATRGAHAGRNAQGEAGQRMIDVRYVDRERDFGHLVTSHKSLELIHLSLLSIYGLKTVRDGLERVFSVVQVVELSRILMPQHQRTKF